MNINHLRYFLAVCEYGSITKAAENIHMSQPSITSAIQYLEQIYGIKLFNRSNKKIALTAEGEQFLQYAQKLVNECDEFTKKSTDLAKNTDITLKVGMPGVLGSFFLDKIVPGFQEQNPGINLEIYEIPTIDGIKKIQDSSLDFVIGITNKISYPNCSSARIFSTELVLAVNNSNPLASRNHVNAKMIQDYPFVTISNGSFHYKILKEIFTDYPIKIVLHSNQVSTIGYMVENDYAVTIIYKEIFKDNPKIKTIPFEEPIGANVNIFWKSDSYCNAASKKFISYLRNIICMSGE